MDGVDYVTILGFNYRVTSNSCDHLERFYYLFFMSKKLPTLPPENNQSKRNRQKTIEIAKETFEKICSHPDIAKMCPESLKKLSLLKVDFFGFHLEVDKFRERKQKKNNFVESVHDIKLSPKLKNKFLSLEGRKDSIIKEMMIEMQSFFETN